MGGYSGGEGGSAVGEGGAVGGRGRQRCGGGSGSDCSRGHVCSWPSPPRGRRSPPTLAIPVDCWISLTLSNPVGCHPALPYLPTAVPRFWSRKKQRCVAPIAPCTLSVRLRSEVVWSWDRVVSCCHLVRHGGVYDTSGPNTTKTQFS